MEAGSRYYTVEEANALVPTLTAVLRDLQSLQQRALAVAREIAEFEQRAQSNGHGEHTEVFSPGHDLDELRAQLEQRILYLQTLGCELKGIEHGIVDFPSRREGREVYLCWRLGEDHVGYWHDIEAGYAGRQPL